MQSTSELYKEILAGEYRTETRLAIGEKDSPISGLSFFCGENILMSMSTSMRIFSAETPTVGGCVSGEISVDMLKPGFVVPRQAKLVPQVRITDGLRYSEWLSKGVFFVDTRAKKGEGTKMETLTLHGFDAMLKAEQDYPSSQQEWPSKDIDVVKEIAEFLGVAIDSRTIELMTNGYMVQYPGEYTCREVLGYIAAMYGGSFIMSDIGELRLVALNCIPPDTQYLVDQNGEEIIIGGVRILV